MSHPRPRVVIVAGRRHPHELFLLGVSVLQGVAYLAGVRTPSPVTMLLPAWVVTAWYLLLLISGAVGLAGNLWPGDVLTAMRIRLSGMLLAAAPAAVFAVTAWAFAGSRVLYSGGLTVAWVGACLWRAGQLGSDIRQVTAGGRS
jgi:hypothetical protein